MLLLAFFTAVAGEPTAPMAPSAHSDTSRTIDATIIKSQARRLSRAFETKQLGVWDEVLTDDFKAITPTGKAFNKTEFIAGGTAEAQAARPPVSVDIRFIRLDIRGGRATAELNERTCYGFRDPKNRKHHLCYRQQFTADWRKKGSTWKLAEVRFAPNQSFRLDGKLISRDQLRKVRSR